MPPIVANDWENRFERLSDRVQLGSSRPRCHPEEIVDPAEVTVSSLPLFDHVQSVGDSVHL